MSKHITYENWIKKIQKRKDLKKFEVPNCIKDLPCGCGRVQPIGTRGWNVGEGSWASMCKWYVVRDDNGHYKHVECWRDVC